jgi:hypothetical protein
LKIKSESARRKKCYKKSEFARQQKNIAKIGVCTATKKYKKSRILHTIPKNLLQITRRQKKHQNFPGLYMPTKNPHLDGKITEKFQKTAEN